MQTVSSLNLTGLLDEPVDWQYKGFPPTDHPVTIGTVGQQGWNALDGDLLFPLLLIKEAALDHNIELMARFCREHDLSLAPHGKTPISPQIVQRQLDAGAWGVSAANLHQARIFRTFGVERIMIANEVLEPAAIGWIAGETERRPDGDMLFLVDSVAGVNLVAQTLERLRPSRPVRVLLEWGAAGGRAGIRGSEAARDVAGAVRSSPYLQLAGIEGYEGAVKGDTFEERLAGVRRYLEGLRTVTAELDEMGVFAGADEIIVSAGGSLFMDQIADVLGRPWNLSQPVRIVMRSGSYFAHDADEYEQFSPLAQRDNPGDRLQQSLELWGMVLSRPEPGLAILGFGKRDISYDIALPMPFVSKRGGELHDLAGKATVYKLNDQHAFLRVDEDVDLAVGDLIGCHISHPCTAFDKWRLLPLVNDRYDVTGAIRTFF